LFPGKGDSDILFTDPSVVVFKLLYHINAIHIYRCDATIILTDCHTDLQDITLAVRIDDHGFIFLGTGHDTNQLELTYIEAVDRKSTLQGLVYIGL